MPKIKNSVRCRTKRIQIIRKTIGGGVKFSSIPSNLSSGHTVVTPVPTPSRVFTENTHITNLISDNCEDETAYTRAKRKELSLWDSLKDEILQVSYKSSAPSSNICNICKEHAEYRCLECSNTSVFCKTCTEKIHVNSLHLPEKWNETCYELAWQQIVLQLSGDHSTHGVYSREIKVFVNTGQLCNFRVDFCACEPEACTLLKYGLWPATPEKPQTAFSVALLELFHHFSLECQVSVEGFCNTLRWKNNLTLVEVNRLYRALVGESISHFRHYYFRRRTLAGLCDLFDDGTACPACIKTDGTMIVTMDANFGLVRKRSSGRSMTEPLHGDRMFVRDEDVEEYLLSHPDSSKPTEDCSNFKAGNLLRSKNQQKKLDITGVFGASCRHEIPLMFLNMTHGERLAYPKYIIGELVKRCQDKNLDLHFIYDIACVLSSHLQKTGDGIPKDLSLAVPAFHVYGHKLQCQIMYSTRRLPGFGLTDGEGMERLWSFLRRFSRVTKEMTPSHRLDFLTDALLYYGRRKSADLDMQLVQRWDKAEKVLSLAEDEISAVLAEAPRCISEQDIQHWMKTEAEVAQTAHLKSRPKDAVPRWKRNYVMKLTEINQLRSQNQESLTVDETQLESDLQTIERHHGIKRRWCQSDEIFQSTLRDLDQEVRSQLILQAQNEARERVTLLNLKKKYPDGQGVAIRLSKQVNACNRRLKKIVTGYNGLQWPPQTTIFPSHLEFQDVCDVSLPLYSSIDEQTEHQGDIPKTLKRRAIDALHLRNRAAEEKLLLQKEMDTLIHHLHQQHGHLHSAINYITDPGSKAVLFHSIVQLEKKLYSAMIMFQSYITVLAPPSNVCLPEFNSVSQTVMSPDPHVLLYDDGNHDKDDEAEDDDVDEDEDDSDCDNNSEDHHQNSVCN